MAKIVIGSVAAVLALLWSAGLWMTAGFVRWVGDLAASGQAADLGRTVAAWPAPTWLTYWVEPQAVQAALDGIAWTLDSVQRSAPWIDAALQWLMPVIALAWALGLVVLVALAALAVLSFAWLRTLRFRRPRWSTPSSVTVG